MVSKVVFLITIQTDSVEFVAQTVYEQQRTRWAAGVSGQRIVYQMNAPNQHSDLAAVLQLGIKAVTAYERPDFAERLRRLQSKVDRTDVQIVVVGEFKQGKSSLVNALLNVRASPVDDDIATAVHTIIKWGPEKRAYALVNEASEPDGEGRRVEIAFNEVRDYATELGETDPSVIVRGVELELQRKLLEDGLILVDTPGVGGLGSGHAAAAIGSMSIADGALFVSDAGQELTRTEAEFLAQAIELCDHVVFVATKTDLYPNWRRVVELNQNHLRRLGINIPMFAVSSSLRLEAVRRKDKQINIESGFADLISYVTDDVIDASRQKTRVEVSEEICAIAGQLSQAFEAEKAMLSNPAESQNIIGALERARAEAEALQSSAARWNTTLRDGVQDLVRDIRHDLETRIRAVRKEAEKAIDNSDPTQIWSELQPWLENAVSQSIITNYRLLADRAGTLTVEVAQHFGQDSSVVFQPKTGDGTPVLQMVDPNRNLDLQTAGVGGKGLSALRGGYSGFLMVSMLGALGGLGGPAGLVAAGAAAGLLGRRAVKDERERELSRNRMEARREVARYCDDVMFHARNDIGETFNMVERQLRDHYDERARELRESTNAAIKKADQAVRTAKQDSQRRLRDVEAELERIGQLRRRAEALVAPASKPEGR